MQTPCLLFDKLYIITLKLHTCLFMIIMSWVLKYLHKNLNLRTDQTPTTFFMMNLVKFRRWFYLFVFVVPDEGPETGDESDEDIVRSYLPPDNHDIMRAFEPHHNIPAINITLHSPNANHVLGKFVRPINLNILNVLKHTNLIIVYWQPK